MDDHRREELREALREKGANEALRKLAVRLVLHKGHGARGSCGHAGPRSGLGRRWVARYREGGMPPPPLDLPRPGRPPLVPAQDIHAIVRGEHAGHVSPAPLLDANEEETGAGHHIAGVRRFLRAFGFSRKRPALVHVNREGPDEVRKWRAEKIPELLRLRRRGHALLAQDG